jgi:protein-disulfide isomerase
VGVLGFVLALGGGFFLGQWINNRPGDVAIEQGPRYRVALSGDEPQLGPDDALVTIIEFADYQCPYCAKASGPLEEAADKFDEDVRVIYKHFPLPSHPQATPAAKAAWAAHQQGKFWEMHAYMFDAKANVDGVDEKAANFGLDAQKFAADRTSEAAAKAVDDDLFAGSKLGVTGTPAFFVNGHQYVGSKTYGQWKEIIKGELEAAEALVDEGTPRADVYDALMKDAVAQRTEPRQAQQPGRPDPAATYQITADGRPQLGPDDALVTIVQFSDFQCPYCSKVAPTVHALVENNSSDVRVVFRNLPLPMHPQARNAAKAALAAHRQGKFWEMHDALFESGADLKDGNFRGLAEKIGLGGEQAIQFEHDMQGEELEQMIAEDEALARRFRISSTPSAFVNGHYVGGAQSVEAFQAVIDREKAKAQAMVDSGTARSDVYDEIMRSAETSRKEGG